jgi:ABC-2 type transport system permease protein
MLIRLIAILKKEFRQVRRDRISLGLLLFLPAFMLIMFGYALNFDVKHIPFAVLDQDNSALSRELIRKFLHSEYFDFKGYLGEVKDIDNLIGREKIRFALVIPPDFSCNLLSGDAVMIQALIDGANANNAAAASGYINMVVQDFSTKIMLQSLNRQGMRGSGIGLDYRPQVRYNPKLKSAKFLVPGLIGFLLMMLAVVSTALSVVREKERGTMEQIIVSPVRPLELILGKTIPFLLTSLVAAVFILLVGYFLFDVEVKGSIILLFISILIFLIGALGYGLLISSIAHNQQVAFTISIVTTMLPSFLLSGFVFPIRNMPVVVQAITYLFPVRYFLVAIRSIMLKGAGLNAFWGQLVMLALFGAVTITISSLRMKRELM